MFKINKKIGFIFVLFLITLLILPCTYILAISPDSVYVWSNSSESVQTSTPMTVRYNRRDSGFSGPTPTGNFLGLTSASAILMDQKTGTILYEHNSHEKLRPASVTKIMTLLLIMESLDKRINIT